MKYIPLKPILFVLALGLSQVSGAQVVDVNSGWKMKKASEVEESGKTLSLEVVDQLGWFDADVPGTVLGSLVREGVYPDPFYGNNYEIIPEILEGNGEIYSYWFITKFIFKNPDNGKEVWLNFRGINHASEIWFNGELLAKNIEGLRSGSFRFNITSGIREDGSNMIAVLISPEADPGSAGTLNEESRRWAKDRNAGIWDKVQIEVTGLVDVRNTYVVARVPKEREPYNIQDPAFLNVTTELENRSSETVKGVAVVEIGGMKIKKKAELMPGSVQTIEFGDIKIKDPKLWWPNGIGPQPLYQLKVSFFGDKDFEYDREIVTTGIRVVGFRIDEETGLGIFTVNGKDIFIKGSNWSASDALLRLSARRYEAEMKLHAGMNMNMVRVKGGSLIERPDFYSSADKYGLLVWQEVSPALNNNLIGVTEESFASQIKMVRNHPGLVMWALPESGDMTMRQIAFFADSVFGKLDQSRLFFQSIATSTGSSTNIFGSSEEIDNLAELSEFYTNRFPSFTTAIGREGFPESGSLKLFVPPAEMAVPENNKLSPFWKTHQYKSTSPLIEKYGTPVDFNDFSVKSQLLSYEYYRAIAEGYNAKMWSWYSGILTSRSQSPGPILQGQLYDTYLGQNAGYYGFMTGAKPFHIQLNLADTSVVIVNSSAKSYTSITGEITVFNLKGEIVFSQSMDFDSKPNSVTQLVRPEIPGKSRELLFVRLRLINRRMSERLDENIYWLGSHNEGNRSLAELPQTFLETNITHMSDGKMLVELVNSSDVTAFFVKIQFRRDDNKENLEQVFLDNNYVTVFPGEKKRIVADLSSTADLMPNDYIEMRLEGINTPARSVVFQK